MKEYRTDEIFPDQHCSPPLFADVPAGTTRLIDVHIYDLPSQEEMPSIESTLDMQEQTRPHDQDAQERMNPLPACLRRMHLLPLLPGVFCFLTICVLIVLSLLPVLTATATITIIPISKQITTTSTLTVVPGQANGTQQLAGREVTPVTMSQARTVPTTGRGHQDARSAHGTVTFYNAAPAMQTVTAGTLLTGTDSVQIVTDQDASIPAAAYPTFGQANVPAHAVVGGSVGNIKAGDIYGPCCRLNISAVNSAFTGGQQARDYQTVTPQDVNTTATELKTSLDQSVQAALQTQVHSDETLIPPLPCQQEVHPDHQPGDEAAQVNITVTETCTGMAYNTQAYQRLMTQIESQVARQQLGEGYSLIGATQSTITQVIPKDHGKSELQVKIAASWWYQFTQEQQAHIKALLAGKGKAQAIKTLLHLPGVQSVSLSITNERTTLPTDSTHIHLMFLIMP